MPPERKHSLIVTSYANRFQHFLACLSLACHTNSLPWNAATFITFFSGASTLVGTKDDLGEGAIRVKAKTEPVYAQLCQTEISCLRSALALPFWKPHSAAWVQCAFWWAGFQVAQQQWRPLAKRNEKDMESSLSLVKVESSGRLWPWVLSFQAKYSPTVEEELQARVEGFEWGRGTYQPLSVSGQAMTSMTWYLPYFGCNWTVQHVAQLGVMFQVIHLEADMYT